MIKKVIKFIGRLVESIGKFFKKKKEAPEQSEQKEETEQKEENKSEAEEKKSVFPY